MEAKSTFLVIVNTTECRLSLTSAKKVIINMVVYFTKVMANRTWNFVFLATQSLTMDLNQTRPIVLSNMTNV